MVKTEKPQNLKGKRVISCQDIFFSQATNYTNHLVDNCEKEKAFTFRNTRVPDEAFLELQRTDLPAHNFSLN